MIFAAHEKTVGIYLAILIVIAAAPAPAQEAMPKAWDEVLRLMQTRPKEWTESLRLAPLMTTGAVEAPNKVIFIWGRECSPCAEAYQALWGATNSDEKRQKTMAIMIQYETNSGRIHQVVDSMCASPARYAWQSMNYLLSRTDNGKEIELPPELEETTGYVKSGLCAKKATARKHMQVFMKEIGKGYKIDSLPIVILNGKRLPPPYDGLGTLQ